MVVGLVAGVVSSLRTPVYRATARVLLTPNDPTQQLNPTGGLGVVGNDPDRYVAGQINIVESEGVAAEAAKALSGTTVKQVEDAVSVGQSGQSNVLKISANHTDPGRAREIAAAVARGYIENRRQAAVAGLQGAADDIQNKLAPLQAQIAELDTQIGSAAGSTGGTSQLVSPSVPGSSVPPAGASQVGGPSGPGGVATTAEALKAARYAAAVQFETLYSRQQELLVDISLKRGDAELIDEPKVPESPVSPNPKRDAALGVFVGLLLGGGISVLREQLNDRVRTAAEVEELAGLPLLAQLPYDEESAQEGSDVAVMGRPNSPLSESVRALRTSIKYLGVDQPVKTVLVTSAAPGEGKSLVALNLAGSFAQAGYRTLLMSADLRRSSIDDAFGDLGPSIGLTGLIAGFSANGTGPNSANGNGHAPVKVLDMTEATAGIVFQKTPMKGLLLLPAGSTPPNPAELLGSRRATMLMTECRDQFDMVVIDSPPLLPVTDAAVLGAKCDGVVLVASINQTRRDALTRSRAILDGTSARLLGVVVNKSPTSGTGSYYYAGYYGGERSEPRSARPLRRVGDRHSAPAVR